MEGVIIQINMSNQFLRTELLLGKENIKILHCKKVLTLIFTHLGTIYAHTHLSV